MYQILLLLCLQNPVVPEVPIKITESVSGEVGDFLFITAEAKGTVKFYSPDPRLKMFPQALLKDPKSLIVYSKVPGTYKIYAWTAVNGEPSDLVFATIIVIGSVPPNPNPVPPGPVPPNPTSKFLIIVAYDTTNTTTNQAALLNDIKFWNSVSDRGHTIKIWDSKSSEAMTAGIAAQVNKFGTGYPVLVIAKPSGEVIKAFKFPTTKDGINSIIKDQGGL